MLPPARRLAQCVPRSPSSYQCAKTLPSHHDVPGRQSPPHPPRLGRPTPCPCRAPPAPQSHSLPRAHPPATRRARPAAPAHSEPSGSRFAHPAESHCQSSMLTRPQPRRPFQAGTRLHRSPRRARTRRRERRTCGCAHEPTSCPRSRRSCRCAGRALASQASWRPSRWARASCCSAPLMSTVVVHAHWCRSGSLWRWALCLRQALGHSAVGRTHGVQQPLRVAAMHHRRGRGSTRGASSS